MCAGSETFNIGLQTMKFFPLLSLNSQIMNKTTVRTTAFQTMEWAWTTVSTNHGFVRSEPNHCLSTAKFKKKETEAVQQRHCCLWCSQAFCCAAISGPTFAGLLQTCDTHLQCVKNLLVPFARNDSRLSTDTTSRPFCSNVWEQNKTKNFSVCSLRNQNHKRPCLLFVKLKYLQLGKTQGLHEAKDVFLHGNSPGAIPRQSDNNSELEFHVDLTRTVHEQELAGLSGYVWLGCLSVQRVWAREESFRLLRTELFSRLLIVMGCADPREGLRAPS